MKNDIAYVLANEAEIEEICEQLGTKISEDYKDKNVIIVSVLKGAFVFCADVFRHITIPCAIDFMAISSYGSGTTPGAVRLIKDLGVDIAGMDVLIVEDILDSGKSLSYTIELLKARKPASIKICTLLDKPDRRQADITADYVGKVIPDEFVVGYGLDYDEKYRNLPYIGVLKPEVYSD
ncbi:MAG: hypoxanthine phosphoribosyltransferase [Clostridia bacterium]|nr:hypoxanthine phosphoribosyltransferase [Clostridia bacterium]